MRSNAEMDAKLNFSGCFLCSLFVVKMKQSKGIIREAMGMGRFDG
jgi:hypothetical protein